MPNILNNILLSNHTTIKLGGYAKYFCVCNSENDITYCINYARENNLNIQILGGGSNTIFSDEGYNGLILKINLKGISIHNDFKDSIIIKFSAGEEWDDVVKYCVENNYSGIECLSGIPGSAGATPIQNVGAYGLEVKDTIVFVNTIERNTLKSVIFSNEDCLFGYRTSRFKTIDKDKYIITEILFKLEKGGKPEIKYPELIKYINENVKSKDLKNGKPNISTIRNSVLQLRKNKSMVINEDDPDSISCGSFFTNPVLSEKEFEKFKKKLSELSIIEFPNFKTPEGIKLSAAWLIENSGFKKGYIKNGVGISSKHTLALINKFGTTKAILELSKEIQNKVHSKFNIHLIPEPVIKN